MKKERMKQDEITLKQNERLRKKRGNSIMKQIIVLVAMIILGIAIAGMVLQFQGTADSISKDANQKVVDIFKPTPHA